METNSPESYQLNEWISISPDGDVTIVVSKTEMGQGAHTSLTMIVADELEADWNKVRVVSSPARDEYRDPISGLQNTGGSTSVRNMYDYLRRAAAQARTMLETAAAEEWGVPVTECTAHEGSVQNEKSGESLPYGKLAGRASRIRPPEEPSLKSRDQFRLIGKSLPRIDIPSKVEGTAIFGLDISHEGMIYASVARPPTFGATLLSFDEESAAGTPGVEAVVRIDRGVAVCARTMSAAWAGRNALNAQWDSGSHPELSTASLEKTFGDALGRDGLVVKDDGDVVSALAQASRRVSAGYVLPYLAHCCFEPMNCTVHVQPDLCEIWIPTQLQTWVVEIAHKETGLREDQIHVHTTYAGGGFGRRLENDFLQEAVQIAKSVRGPVKLVWTREEDMRYDLFRPGSACRIDAGIDSAGKVIAWSHKTAVSSILERFSPQFMAGQHDPTTTEGVVGMEYGIPNLRIEWVKTDTPVPVGFWRSVGHSGNAFIVESFIDELAYTVREDPLEFRLKLLRGQPRPCACLEKVAKESHWGESRGQGRGQGIAQHFSFGSYTAAVADVSVDPEQGGINVERIVCAIDCGSAVNPDGLAAQMEGAVCMGLSAALKEQVHFENGRVISSNFRDYPLLSMSEAPEIDVHIIESGKALGGVGEPGLPPVAPAVANAVFDAVGLRIRRLPMTPEVVKKARSAG